MQRFPLPAPQWSSLGPIGLLLMTILILPGPLAAGPVAGKVQPDALTFGAVRVGATVEGSLRVFEDGDDTTGVAVKIKAPSFVRVKDQVLGTQTYGNLGTKIVCDISVSIDTSKSEDYVDNLDIQVGNQNVTVPVSVLVQPREAGLTRLLVVETPFQKFSTGDSSDFSPWLDLAKEAKLDVDYWLVDPKQPVLRNKDLSNFDVALVAGDGLFRLGASDRASLRKFLNRGGRLILPAQYFLRGTVAAANELLVPYGLRMDDTESAQVGQKVLELSGADIVDDPLTQGVQELKFHRPSPINVIDQAKGKILVKAPPYPDAGFVAVGRSGKGEVVALGTSLWWNWIGGQREKGADNARLLQNLITGPRQKR